MKNWVGKGGATDGAANNKKGKMAWWQLSLLGVGCTIGTVLVLGSSTAIKKNGPAVLIPCLLAAIRTYIVYDTFEEMLADHHHPVKGSFRSYSKQARIICEPALRGRDCSCINDDGEK